jgi:hypothetical protein
MGLLLTGKVLGVASEEKRDRQGSPFTVHSVSIMAGNLPSGDPKVERVQLGRGVEPASFKVDDDATVECYVRSYPKGDGKAGYQLMATAVVEAGKGLRAAV